jgi:two-component system sensor histidine kinase/response regulator
MPPIATFTHGAHAPKPAAPPAHEVLDPEQIGELRRLHVLREAAESFIQDAPRFRSELRAALGHGDALKLAEIAHKLKGSAGVFGAHGLLNLCASFEKLCEGGFTPTCEEGVRALDESLRAVLTALERECDL